MQWFANDPFLWVWRRDRQGLATLPHYGTLPATTPKSAKAVFDRCSISDCPGALCFSQEEMVLLPALLLLHEPLRYSAEHDLFLIKHDTTSFVWFDYLPQVLFGGRDEAELFKIYQQLVDMTPAWPPPPPPRRPSRVEIEFLDDLGFGRR